MLVDKNMEKIRPDAILFDMDGVLVDSLDSWWKSLNASFRKYNESEISREEFIKKYWGRDLQYNLKHMGLSYEILSFCNVVYGNYVDVVKIYPDTKSTLEELSDYKKAIITNTPKGCAVQIVKNLGLESFFDNVFTADEVSMGKPSPEIVLKACSFLDVEPENVIVVGDTVSDIEAGHAAGCKVVGVKIDADYRVESLSELLDVLDF